MSLLKRKDVRHLAHQHGWQEVHHNASTQMLGFTRGPERAVVFYATGTVGTCTNWARLGKTLSFTKLVGLEQLDDILCNVPLGGNLFRRFSDKSPEPPLGEREWWGITHEDELFRTSYLPDEFVLVALGHSFVTVTADGMPRFGEDIPAALKNRLIARNKRLPCVDIVAFGPEKDTFFVQFVDGEQVHRQCPTHMTATLEEYARSSHKVQTLALGPKRSWYVCWDDGCADWHNIPSKLQDLLRSPDLATIRVDELALGPAGEWFVRFQNGSWSCGGIKAEDCLKRIQKIRHQGADIVCMTFGTNSTWLVVSETVT